MPLEGAPELLPPFVPSRTRFAAAHPAPEPARDAALGAVAQRLERIAATLRRGSLEELLARLEESSEETDPLDLLITGYALGYAQASRRAESDPLR